MATYTENYNLKKPGSDDFYDIGDLNGNMDIIDAALKEMLLSPKNIFANGIINGDFQVWQNGETILPSAANHAVLKGYTADMWQVYPEDGSLTASKVVYNQTVAKQALRLVRNVNSANTAQYLWYDIPADESKKYIGRKLTVSFSCRVGSAFAGTISVKIINKKTSEAVLLNEAFSPQTTDQIFYFTTSAIAPADLEYLRVLFTYNSSTSTAVANDYFEITNVNLSGTSFYTPFSPKSFADELRDCMLYYEKNFQYGVAPSANESLENGYVGVASCYGVMMNVTAYAKLNIHFIVPKPNNTYTMTSYGVSEYPSMPTRWVSKVGNSTTSWSDDSVKNASITTDIPAFTKFRDRAEVDFVEGVDSQNILMPYAYALFGYWVADARLANSLN